jgi:antitoxin (DNA-binding transcriptional repressor) of toxin-antitoxin stability system
MKDINVSELKAGLSKYLRLASRGVRILVRDRDEPIAEIGPPQATSTTSWVERMAGEGRLRRGTQRWNELRIARLDKRIDIQASLREVREDPREIRRR